MEGVTYRISAHDLLFFGTGRPFTIEDESWTLGIFPPYPATIYGFLRSVYFENNMGDLENADDKDIDPTKDLEISDYHLELETNGTFVSIYLLPNCFFKIPGTITKNANGENIVIKAKPEMMNLETEVPISNYPWTYMLKQSSEDKLENYGPLTFVTKDQLQQFLEGNSITEVIELDKLMIADDQIGISKDGDTGLASEGKLYRIRFNNMDLKENKMFKKIHFNITISGLEFKLENSHGRRLGGEGKIAFLSKAEEKSENDKPQNKLPENGGTALIYIQTPCILECEAKLIAELDKYNLKLLCIANRGFLDIGGWDIQKRMPKPMEAALPPGSLIFVEAINGGTIKEFNTLGEKTKEGFGKILMGTFKNQE